MLQLIKSYTIKGGDTLSRIAKQVNITLPELLKMNQQIIDPDKIMIGQVINVPDSAPISSRAGATFDGINPAPGTIVIARAQVTNPPLINDANNRHRDIYEEVIDQFAVGHNPRHLPTQGFTFCNIFLWDVTRAMTSEIPHWIDAAGAIAKPFASGANEITINAGVDWLRKFGPANGWLASNQDQAQDNANKGCPSVVVWKNPTGGHGHTAVIRPGNSTNQGPLIAQAGARNFNIGRLVQGFGTRTGLRYFIHA
ncbi:hypothetical protein GCM10028818_37870 [Spirosoma horti]